MKRIIRESRWVVFEINISKTGKVLKAVRFCDDGKKITKKEFDPQSFRVQTCLDRNLRLLSWKQKKNFLGI